VSLCVFRAPLSHKLTTVRSPKLLELEYTIAAIDEGNSLLEQTDLVINEGQTISGKVCESI
jgi:tagatose-1,6-bisphosphate aldolase